MKSIVSRNVCINLIKITSNKTIYTQSCTNVGQNYIVKQMLHDIDTIKIEQKE